MSVKGLAILKEKEDKKRKEAEGKKKRKAERAEKKKQRKNWSKRRKRSVSGRQKKRKIYWLVLRRHQLGTRLLCVSPTVSVVSVSGPTLT